ncbi:alpha/beta fold hydrolase [Nocardia gipuzkoensis]|uniref:alpha/beta fold hydrolase n=1 Tax=Nocardia gipuzkoensis TaxID=2749991 RepID=UPI003EE1473F
MASKAQREPTARCDQTGIKRTDYLLEFEVPNNLMPDNQFAGKKAHLRVHRVGPTYADGDCKASKAMVLIHGRTVGGSVSFDLQHQTPGFAALSLQEALAYAGIDTFAPDLLGYGLSTRFSLDDPANASLPGFTSGPDGVTCSNPVGCDKTRGIFPLGQQATQLATNPLEGSLKKHTSSTHFANTNVWARDIKQVIDDAKAKTGLNKVALLGYSLGGPRVGRVWYELGNDASAVISHLIFLSTGFNAIWGADGIVMNEANTEESEAEKTATTFPLTLASRSGWDKLRGTTDCPGREPPGAAKAFFEQAIALDPIGAKWGGTVSNEPTGLLRAPTFTNTGWNSEIAKTIKVPTLILHGQGDATLPALNAKNLYDTLTVQRKVAVTIECAGHLMQYDTAATWEGPHRAVADAIIEWVDKQRFNGESAGRFTIDRNGVTKTEP